MVKSIFIALLLLLVVSCNNDDRKVIIEGEISNLESPFIISSFHTSDSIIIDTISVNNKGKFSYSHYVDTNEILTLYFNDFHSSTVLFIEKGINKIKLKGDAILPDLIEVKGGDINNDLSFFKKENETILKQRSLLISKFEDEDSIPVNSINIISEKEKIALLNSLNHELAQNVEDFILQNPDKISSVILINEFFKNNENPKTLERVLEYLEGDVLDFPLTKKLIEYNRKLLLSAEGALMPFFQLTDINGKNLNSNDFKDKYLLISFLSANNEESNENLKILKDEYSNLNKDSIEFVSIYIDSDTFPILNNETDSIPWKIIIENESWGSKIVDTYNIHYAPFNILINPQSIIETRDVPINEIKNLISSKTDKSKS